MLTNACGGGGGGSSGGGSVGISTPAAPENEEDVEISIPEKDKKTADEAQTEKEPKLESIIIKVKEGIELPEIIYISIFDKDGKFLKQEVLEIAKFKDVATGDIIFLSFPVDTFYVSISEDQHFTALLAFKFLLPSDNIITISNESRLFVSMLQEFGVTINERGLVIEEGALERFAEFLEQNSDSKVDPNIATYLSMIEVGQLARAPAKDSIVSVADGDAIGGGSSVGGGESGNKEIASVDADDASLEVGTADATQGELAKADQASDGVDESVQGNEEDVQDKKAEELSDQTTHTLSFFSSSGKLVDQRLTTPDAEGKLVLDSLSSNVFFVAVSDKQDLTEIKALKYVDYEFEKIDDFFVDSDAEKFVKWLLEAGLEYHIEKGLSLSADFLERLSAVLKRYKGQAHIGDVAILISLIYKLFYLSKNKPMVFVSGRPIFKNKVMTTVFKEAVDTYPTQIAKSLNIEKALEIKGYAKAWKKLNRKPEPPAMHLSPHPWVNEVQIFHSFLHKRSVHLYETGTGPIVYNISPRVTKIHIFMREEKKINLFGKSETLSSLDISKITSKHIKLFGHSSSGVSQGSEVSNGLYTVKAKTIDGKQAIEIYFANNELEKDVFYTLGIQFGRSSHVRDFYTTFKTSLYKREAFKEKPGESGSPYYPKVYFKLDSEKFLAHMQTVWGLGADKMITAKAFQKEVPHFYFNSSFPFELKQESKLEPEMMGVSFYDTFKYFEERKGKKVISSGSYFKGWSPSENTLWSDWVIYPQPEFGVDPKDFLKKRGLSTFVIRKAYPKYKLSTAVLERLGVELKEPPWGELVKKYAAQYNMPEDQIRQRLVKSDGPKYLHQFSAQALRNFGLSDAEISKISEEKIVLEFPVEFAGYHVEMELKLPKKEEDPEKYFRLVQVPGLFYAEKSIAIQSSFDWQCLDGMCDELDESRVESVPVESSEFVSVEGGSHNSCPGLVRKKEITNKLGLTFEERLSDLTLRGNYLSTVVSASGVRKPVVPGGEDGQESQFGVYGAKRRLIGPDLCDNSILVCTAWSIGARTSEAERLQCEKRQASSPVCPEYAHKKEVDEHKKKVKIYNDKLSSGEPTLPKPSSICFKTNYDYVEQTDDINFEPKKMSHALRELLMLGQVSVAQEEPAFFESVWYEIAQDGSVKVAAANDFFKKYLKMSLVKKAYADAAAEISRDKRLKFIRQKRNSYRILIPRDPELRWKVTDEGLVDLGNTDYDQEWMSKDVYSYSFERFKAAVMWWKKHAGKNDKYRATEVYEGLSKEMLIDVLFESNADFANQPENKDFLIDALSFIQWDGNHIRAIKAVYEMKFLQPAFKENKMRFKQGKRRSVSRDFIMWNYWTWYAYLQMPLNSQNTAVQHFKKLQKRMEETQKYTDLAFQADGKAEWQTWPMDFFLESGQGILSFLEKASDPQRYIQQLRQDVHHPEVLARGRLAKSWEVLKASGDMLGTIAYAPKKLATAGKLAMRSRSVATGWEAFKDIQRIRKTLDMVRRASLTKKAMKLVENVDKLEGALSQVTDLSPGKVKLGGFGEVDIKLKSILINDDYQLAESKTTQEELTSLVENKYQPKNQYERLWLALSVTEEVPSGQRNILVSEREPSAALPEESNAYLDEAAAALEESIGYSEFQTPQEGREFLKHMFERIKFTKSENFNSPRYAGLTEQEARRLTNQWGSKAFGYSAWQTLNEIDRARGEISSDEWQQMSRKEKQKTKENRFKKERWQVLDSLVWMHYDVKRENFMGSAKAIRIYEEKMMAIAENTPPPPEKEFKLVEGKRTQIKREQWQSDYHAWEAEKNERLEPIKKGFEKVYEKIQLGQWKNTLKELIDHEIIPKQEVVLYLSKLAFEIQHADAHNRFQFDMKELINEKIFLVNDLPDGGLSGLDVGERIVTEAIRAGDFSSIAIVLAMFVKKLTTLAPSYEEVIADAQILEYAWVKSSVQAAQRSMVVLAELFPQVLMAKGITVELSPFVLDAMDPVRKELIGKQFAFYSASGGQLDLWWNVPLKGELYNLAGEGGEITIFGDVPVYKMKDITRRVLRARQSQYGAIAPDNIAETL